MGTVIVVGDLVTDVLVEHDGPIRAGSDTAAAIRVSGGGQAANTAAWLARAGRATTLVAAVGADQAGRDRVAELVTAGVGDAIQVRAGAVTGSVVVLTGADERTMITDRGACLLLDPEHVTAAIRAAAPGGHLHLSGYPLLHAGSRPAGLAALTAAKDQGITVSVDAASAAPLRDAGAELFLAWVRGVDLLLCNADEATVLAGPGDAVAQASRLTEFVQHAVVKRGAGGAVWASRDGSSWSVPGVPVPVKDPTGAGDAFAAGLLAAWLAGAAPPDALTSGAALGAAAVQHVGARPPRPVGLDRDTRLGPDPAAGSRGSF
ncbi:carbohydrate kinase family protein [Actinoplanes sp. L3-i22]|uniref:carbohydrate kinase family protein n=1 Tax=Actinoplanes sp. L3-i22 TaxID=2836373 RepID=UPI001C78C6AB|nr:PfkB family carbohydrate kinase [Actinoplanes sp. L3-i22]BCY14351.1 ribokinase [Actinoplanes sp. L3-i22]